ncbi:diaminopimelate epimerase [Sphingomonas lacunae]|uniref:Diaminopimelate epimerase n=1 Tax=Sphingomonas lacunae TaxID=2698828 RepID=A0A6M4AV65_9SPHN|nr:diaminopimelate epimerase [Sphingomonas lacunae]QJQ32993.1 diaminopimelate epimerase [Sphingomonas lacunae]
MIGEFIKMHGLGNDFVVIDARQTPVTITAESARAIADRHEGIGCDQLILVEPSTVADVRMRIWNADGSEVESCGNATRCVARLVGGSPRIETSGGLLCADLSGGLISIDFPPPAFDWDAIPLAYPIDTLAMPVSWDDLSGPIAINVGNPHIIFFVPDCDSVELDRLGPLIEHDALFPERINVNVATVTGPSAIRLRVWERGVGLTRACGTGAIATAAAALRSRRVTGPVTVSLPGGELIIDQRADGSLVMQGPAVEVFRGTTDWARFE